MQALKKWQTYIVDVLLFIIYLITFACLRKYYPFPQISWDSFYYVETSITWEHGIRPMGYAWFLRTVYNLNNSLDGLVWAQFVVFYISAFFFIKAVARLFNLPLWLYTVIGVLVLIEPVSLYHINNVLSDLLFASLSTLAIAMLMFYLHSRNFIFILFHIILVFISIEIRYVALFYPFFTCIILLFSEKKWWRKLVILSVILLTYFTMHNWHVDQNRKHFGVPVYSAFTGWTHANNALYAVPRIKLDAKYIANPDISRLHAFFSTYFDTSSFVVGEIGSGFLWPEKSPLNVLRTKLADSLGIDYNTSWFRLADYYHYYGLYIQKNFPYEYVMSYMYPNLPTLIHPNHGEMGGFVAAPYFSSSTQERYNVKYEEAVKCDDVYHEKINAMIDKLYSVELASFVLLSIFFLYFRKRFDKRDARNIATMIFFVVSFYGLMLYSSWFIYRYLMPLFPVMVTVIVVIIYKVITNRKQFFEKPIVASN